MAQLMVAATSQTKFFFLPILFLLLSCSDQIIIVENDQINGMNVQQFIRSTEFSGKINIMFDDKETLKSSRTYKKGLKNGKHLGWWENGNKKYEFYFKNDQSEGKHLQWHQNGKLFTQKNFRYGLEDGEQKGWDMQGNLMYKYIYNDGRKYGIQGSILCNGGKELAIEND